MAKSSAERKAAQRARQSAAGSRKIELVLDAQERDMLARNCSARRPGREPYDAAEYIALLIRQDDARVRSRIKSISNGYVGSAAMQYRSPVAPVPVIRSAGLLMGGMRRNLLCDAQQYQKHRDRQKWRFSFKYRWIYNLLT